MSTQENTLQYLQRYRSIAPNFEQLCRITRQPQPRAIWLNPLIDTPFEPHQRIRKREPEAVRIPYLTNAWRLPPSSSPGRWPEYSAGHFHTQEESTIWPADALGAKPGETILDLCAAPGSKTVRIAAAMRDQGTIVANEKQWQRLTSLRYNLTRLGVTSAITVCSDGCELDASFHSFDRVIADVPCTCEGTGRKSGGRVKPTSSTARKYMTNVQTGLLRSALSYVAPGGIVVYATCTYAPEENEGVLSRIPENEAKIIPLTPPEQLHTRPGIREFQGVTFRSDVIHACRMWAHENNSGGFFVAKLQKLP